MNIIGDADFEPSPDPDNESGQSSGTAPLSLCRSALAANQAAENSGPGTPNTLGEVLKLSDRCKSDTVLPSLSEFIASRLHWDGIPDQIPIDLLFEKKGPLRAHLAQAGFSAEKESKYRESFRLLLEEARFHGWQPDRSLSSNWRDILPHAQRAQCAELVRYFSRHGVEPADLDYQRVNDWINRRVIARERGFYSAWEMGSHFTTLLVRRGFTNVNPIAAARLEYYGIPLKDFRSEELKEQVTKLIQYRLTCITGSTGPNKDEKGNREDEKDNGENETGDEEDEKDNGNDDEIEDPNQKRQVRRVTAAVLEGTICRIYGFLVKVKKRTDVNSLEQLFQPKVLRRYKRWLIKEHEFEPWAPRRIFEVLASAASQSRVLATRYVWIRNFMRSMPLEAAPEQRARMAAKCLPYEDLQKIPDALLAERLRLRKDVHPSSTLDIGKLAERLAMKELLMRWLLILPWRARNICELRMGHSLYKAPISAYHEGLPRWIQQEHDHDPTADFWQYRFEPEECKGRASIHRPLPRELINYLEAYLNEFRPDLNDWRKEGKFSKLSADKRIFRNFNGDPLDVHKLYCIICELTLQFGGKRASTKILRDVFAFHYLRTHQRADRFYRLSKELWHSHESTTRRYYATEYKFSDVSAHSSIYAEARKAKKLRDSAYEQRLIDEYATIWAIAALVVCVLLLWLSLNHPNIIHLPW